MSTRKGDRMRVSGAIFFLVVFVGSGVIHAADEEPQGGITVAAVEGAGSGGMYPATVAPPSAAPDWGDRMASITRATAVTRGFKSMYQEKLVETVTAKQAHIAVLNTAIVNADQVILSGRGDATHMRTVKNNIRAEWARCQQEIAVLHNLMHEVGRLPDDWTAVNPQHSSDGSVASHLDGIAKWYEGQQFSVAGDSAAKFYGLYQAAQKKAKQSRRILSSSRDDRRASDRLMREKLEMESNRCLQECAKALQERFIAIEVAVRGEVAALHNHARGVLWPYFSSWLAWQDSEPSANAPPLTDNAGGEVPQQQVHVSDIKRILSGESASAEVTAFFAERIEWRSQEQDISVVLGSDVSEYIDERAQEVREGIITLAAAHCDNLVKLARSHGQAVSSSGDGFLPTIKGLKEAEALQETVEFVLKSERGLRARMRLLNECAQLANRISRKMQPVLTAGTPEAWRTKKVKNAVKIVVREVVRLDSGTQESMWAWLKEKMRQVASRLSELPGIRRKMNERFAMLSTLHPDAGFVGELLMEGIERFAPGLTADDSDDGEDLPAAPRAVVVPPVAITAMPPATVSTSVPSAPPVEV